MNIWNWLSQNHNNDFQIIEVTSVLNFSTTQIILNVQKSSIVPYLPNRALQQFLTSPGHHQNWLYGDVMRNGNMAAKARHAMQSIFRALFVP